MGARTDLMKMTDTGLPARPALRDLFRAVCRQFAMIPLAQRPDGRHGDVAPPRTAADATSSMGAAGIAPEDWDLLFRAALDLLARVAVEKEMPGGIGVPLQEPGTALRECMDALDQLRRAVPPFDR